MKRTFTTFFFLTLVFALNAQTNFSYQENIKSITESKVFQNYMKSKKYQSANKALNFDQAYYNLQYDTSTTMWDSINRVSEFIDNAVSNPAKGVFSQLTENYNGQFYIKSDSSFGVIDTSYNSYKVPENIGVFDTIKTFTYDSANTSWVPFIQNNLTVNSNKDITKLETFLNLAVLGLPGGTITLFAQSNFHYDVNNNLNYWVEKEFSFGSGLVNADSVVVTTNSAGYRTVDEIFEWNGSSWDLAEKMLYTYNANNELVDEILQTYDQSNSTYINSNRNKYTYNSLGNVLTDTSFTHPGVWEVNRIEVRTYTSFGDDLSRIDYAIDNGAPYIFSQQDYYYNASNKRDSVVEQSRQTHSTTVPLRFYEKEIYRYTPFPAGGGTASTVPLAPTGLLVTPGTKSVVPNMNLTWIDNSSNELGFAIERSLDSSNWTIIDSVNMNSTVYDDTNIVSATKYYYRIVAFNLNGNSTYSNGASGTSLAVGINDPYKPEFSFYPNPVQNQLNIQGLTKSTLFQVIDINGRILKSFTINQDQAINLESLSSGVYYIKTVNNTFKIIKR